MIHDLVVYRHAPVGDLGEVGLDVPDARLQALQGGELFGDAGGEGGRGRVFDVAQEVLDADFFSFFGFDGGGDV